MSTSAATAVGRSTSLVRANVTAPDAVTSSRSCTALLTAALNRLRAVSVMVSLTPTLAPPGIATCATSDAVAP